MAYKFYAVRKGFTPGIYTSWDLAKQEVNGYSGAEYKGYHLEQDALDYMNETNSCVKQEVIAEKQEIINSHPENYAYVDGSYNPETKTYGFGGFLVTKNGEHVLMGSSNDAKSALMRNVAGEIDGAVAAVKKALELNLTSLAIYYDYQGIESWATRDWKANKTKTKEYQDFMSLAMMRINITFVKVQGHTGIDGNERADALAKKAVGVN